MTREAVRNLLTTGVGVGHWVLDSGASTIHISHRTMWGMGTVRGSFNFLGGEGSVETGGRVSGELRIDATSIETSNKKRDADLRSAAFFDVEKYPEIIVRIASAGFKGDDVQLQAELEVKGIRESLPCTGQVNMASNGTVAVTVVATVDRERFGMTVNKMGMIKGLATATVTAIFVRNG